MADTTTITVEQSTKERLESDKPDGMTWDTYLSGLPDGVTVRLDPETIDDIAAQTAGMTADALETRLR